MTVNLYPRWLPARLEIAVSARAALVPPFGAATLSGFGTLRTIGGANSTSRSLRTVRRDADVRGAGASGESWGERHWPAGFYLMLPKMAIAVGKHASVPASRLGAPLRV